MSVPISIWTKRYTPLCAGAVIGSAADAWEAKKKCGAIADEVIILLLLLQVVG